MLFTWRWTESASPDRRSSSMISRHLARAIWWYSNFGASRRLERDLRRGMQHVISRLDVRIHELSSGFSTGMLRVFFWFSLLPA